MRTSSAKSIFVLSSMITLAEKNCNEDSQTSQCNYFGLIFGQEGSKREVAAAAIALQKGRRKLSFSCELRKVHLHTDIPMNLRCNIMYPTQIDKEFD